MTIRTLNVTADAFDTVNTFMVEWKNHRGRADFGTAYLLDAREREGTVYIMQRSACLKSHYTAADTAERDRLLSEDTLKNGDVVEFDGQRWNVLILGNYSDCGRLVPLKD